MNIATIMVTLSIQTTDRSEGSPDGPKSWNKPKANKIAAAINSEAYKITILDGGGM
jgi:hypothetical protein